MEASKIQNYIKEVLENMPTDWLNLTTHRLDIYDESLAKTQFLEQFESLFISNNSGNTTLYDLPTAYDYIRLGHPLSSILEMPCFTAFSTNGCNKNIGISSCNTFSSTFITNSKRSPKRVCSISK